MENVKYSGLDDLRHICMGGEEYLFIQDKRFVERTPDTEINKNGHNGLIGTSTGNFGYIKTPSGKK